MTYATAALAPLAGGGKPSSPVDVDAFGALWQSSLHKTLSISTGQVAVRASRGDGRVLSFQKQAGVFVPPQDINDRLVSVPGGFLYTDAQANAEELYDTSGALQSISYANGQKLTATYSGPGSAAAPSPGYLIRMQDTFGRAVDFKYQKYPWSGIAARISSITDPSGQEILVSYTNNGMLSALQWQDTQTRQFHYENLARPWLLTGVTGENNVRYSTFSYDGLGRAQSTEHGTGIDRYSVTYATPPWVVETVVFDEPNNTLYRYHSWQPPMGVSVATPAGFASAWDVAGVAGQLRLTNQSQPAGSGCAASTSTATYDANGSKASEDDFNGKRICYANDLSRNLETVRVEGLAGGASGAACAGVIDTAASLPTGSRKSSTEWHPHWRLPVREAAPGRITFFIYNGQPDPFNGGAAASCAPAGATLPSGKPIAVLCKQVEQATTDTDGHLGFAAGLQSSVPARTRSWAYNATGQVVTETNPRGQTTTYVYYPDTTADHTLGDLQTVTNAAAQTTTFNKYDKNGQLLQSTDPNGVVTVNTYDPRGRLLTASVAGLTTSYSYNPVGQLTRITLPDTSWIGYEYDAAHRKTATLDSQGNRIELTMDNQGNVTAQSVKDLGGTLRRALGQVIDALGRVQQATGGV